MSIFPRPFTREEFDAFVDMYFGIRGVGGTIRDSADPEDMLTRLFATAQLVYISEEAMRQSTVHFDRRGELTVESDGVSGVQCTVVDCNSPYSIANRIIILHGIIDSERAVIAEKIRKSDRMEDTINVMGDTIDGLKIACAGHSKEIREEKKTKELWKGTADKLAKKLVASHTLSIKLRGITSKLREKVKEFGRNRIDDEKTTSEESIRHVIKARTKP